MSVSTFTITFTHTVTHVANKMMQTLKEIIREVGLDPSAFIADWNLYETALVTWLGSRHLKRVTLEVYDPQNSALVTRWDIDVAYDTVGEGTLWVNVAAVRYAILKAGLVPSSCRYDLIFSNAPGKPAVPGMSGCNYRATDGLKRHAIGSTIGGNGITADTAYWSRAC